MPIVRIFVCLFLCAACESRRVPLVAETDDVAADFGRTALIDAVIARAKDPKSATAYRTLSQRVSQLKPIFNRDVSREAELRLSFLAIEPLLAGVHLTSTEQMEAFATTIWPTILDFPLQANEMPKEYTKRLCAGPLAVACGGVVPEAWPAIVNARVWRRLKTRTDVAYDRCLWCKEDPNFAKLIDDCHTAHLAVELVANGEEKRAAPSAWPNAGPNAVPKSVNTTVAFRADGWVNVKGVPAPGGNWRKHIGEIRKAAPKAPSILGLHLAPQRMAGDLLQIIGDVKIAGYKKIALITRKKAFPFEKMQYVMSTNREDFNDLRVHRGDTIQVLVQALDLRLANR